MLAFVQEGVERDPAQLEFLREVRAWTAGHITISFVSRTGGGGAEREQI